MPIVRAKSHDVVIRHAGRRVRVTTEWCDVHEDALKRLREEAGAEIEVQGTEPAKSAEEAKPAESSHESKTEKPKTVSRPQGKKEK